MYAHNFGCFLHSRACCWSVGGMLHTCTHPTLVGRTAVGHKETARVKNALRASEALRKAVSSLRLSASTAAAAHLLRTARASAGLSPGKLACCPAAPGTVRVHGRALHASSKVREQGWSASRVPSVQSPLDSAHTWSWHTHDWPRNVCGWLGAGSWGKSRRRPMR